MSTTQDWDAAELRRRLDELFRQAGNEDAMLRSFVEEQLKRIESQPSAKPKPKPQALSTMNSKLREALRE